MQTEAINNYLAKFQEIKVNIVNTGNFFQEKILVNFVTELG